MSARLELVGLSKSFAGNKAVHDVSIKIDQGEIVAVLGENGAGKTTLMNLIYGLLKPDQGELIWQGKQLDLMNPIEARKQGIGIVMQHFSIFESMSVLENLYLHSSITKKQTQKQFERDVTLKAAQYGFDLNLSQLAGSLSIGQQQKLELLRCLMQDDLKLLILDEPTAVLTREESDTLAKLVIKLAESGCSVIYITHKLKEVFKLASRVVILRQGRLVATMPVAEVDEARLVRLMMGDLEPTPAKMRSSVADVVDETLFEIQGLSTQDYLGPGAALDNVNAKILSGEIVGIAGVSGNGQDALIDALSGEYRGEQGTLHYRGIAIEKLSLAQRYRLGISVVAADRLGRSSSASQTLIANFYLKSRLKDRNRVINWNRIKARTQELIKIYSVKCSGPSSKASQLSGGNLQKFIIGREITLQPGLLVCHQPTWGVDMHSADFIRMKLRDLANRGVAVVILSEDLDELMGFCDRLGALYAGKLSNLLPTADTSTDKIGRWMSGASVGTTGGESISA